MSYKRGTPAGDANLHLSVEEKKTLGDDELIGDAHLNLATLSECEVRTYIYKYIYIYIYVYICIYVYVYIYITREREREKGYRGAAAGGVGPSGVAQLADVRVDCHYDLQLPIHIPGYIYT